MSGMRTLKERSQVKTKKKNGNAHAEEIRTDTRQRPGAARKKRIKPTQGRREREETRHERDNETTGQTDHDSGRNPLVQLPSEESRRRRCRVRQFRHEL